MEFKASLDGTAKIVTAAIGILFIGLIGFGITKHNHVDSIIYAAALPLLMLVGCWLYHPSAFEVTENAVIIRRPIGSKYLKRTDIEVILAPTKGEIPAIRIFGVGGVFGYFGLFRNSTVGMMTWYATRLDNMILIKLKSGRNVVISPDNADKLLTLFNSP